MAYSEPYMAYSETCGQKHAEMLHNTNLSKSNPLYGGHLKKWRPACIGLTVCMK